MFSVNTNIIIPKLIQSKTFNKWWLVFFMYFSLATKADFYFQIHKNTL